MSSISDALKKAQHNRIGEPPGSVVPPTRAVPSREEPAPAATSSRMSLTVPVVVALALVLGIILVATQYHSPSPRPSPSRGEGEDAGTLSPIRGAAVDQVPPASEKAVGAAPPSAPVVKTDTGKSDSSAPSPLEGEGRGEGAVAAPVPPKVSEEPLPVLSGTFYSEQNPVAIINGFALKEGETLGAFRVVKILPRGVILKSGSGEVELRLK